MQWLRTWALVVLALAAVGACGALCFMAVLVHDACRGGELRVWLAVPVSVNVEDFPEHRIQVDIESVETGGPLRVKIEP